MKENPQKYYQLYETNESTVESHSGISLYKKDDKFYTLNWGTTISTLADDGKTILFNTEIEGVIAADDEKDAAEKFGLTLVIGEN